MEFKKATKISKILKRKNKKFSLWGGGGGGGDHICAFKSLVLFSFTTSTLVLPDLYNSGIVVQLQLKCVPLDDLFRTKPGQ